MLGVIDKDFYCTSHKEPYKKCGQNIDDNCKGCHGYHRKFPTPEQFKKEYGEDYPSDGAVYYQAGYENDAITDEWYCCTYHEAEKVMYDRDLCYQWIVIVCACTPFGKPDDNWRPEVIK